jgi:hypothetical protein
MPLPPPLHPPPPPQADPHPGNVAVDPQGRLIYYDFGMMGRIPGDVRGGLLELFYGVYQRDADRCLEALITMGVLVRGRGVLNTKPQTLIPKDRRLKALITTGTLARASRPRRPAAPPPPDA